MKTINITVLALVASMTYAQSVCMMQTESNKETDDAAQKITEKLNKNLFIATKNGTVSLVKALLDRNADVNTITKDGFTPLVFAVCTNNYAMAQLLLERKASPNTGLGKNPLKIAAARGDDPMVTLLLDNQAHMSSATTVALAKQTLEIVNFNKDVRYHLQTNNRAITIGQTELVVAAAYGGASTVGLLLDRKADIDLANAAGRTALMAAASEGHDFIVQGLVRYGADTQLHDNCQFTASELARSCRKPTAALLARKKLDPQIYADIRLMAIQKLSQHKKRATTN